MKVIAELYFYDGSYMMTVLKSMKDLKDVHIPKRCYKIIFKKDSPNPRLFKKGDTITQVTVKTMYIGNILTNKEVATRLNKGFLFLGPDFDSACESNDRFILLDDNVHIARVKRQAEIIPTSKIVNGYICEDLSFRIE